MIDKTVGFALSGSFCSFGETMPALEAAVRTFRRVVPILSETAAETDTRFGTAGDHIREIFRICGAAPITTIPGAEPIGPQALLDLVIVAPCTGNTLGKLAHGITDTAVTMAVKAHLRNGRPVLLAVSTNDGLGASGPNLMELMQRKHIYVVPFRQDDPEKKPQSLKADLNLLIPAAAEALAERQLQPVLLG